MLAISISLSLGLFGVRGPLSNTCPSLGWEWGCNPQEQLAAVPSHLSADNFLGRTGCLPVGTVFHISKLAGAALVRFQCGHSYIRIGHLQLSGGPGHLSVAEELWVGGFSKKFSIETHSKTHICIFVHIYFTMFFS